MFSGNDTQKTILRTRILETLETVKKEQIEERCSTMISIYGVKPRTAAIMVRWEFGQGYREIARELRITPGSVAGVIYRNRKDGPRSKRDFPNRPRNSTFSRKQMKSRTDDGRLKRWALNRKGFDRLDLLKNALKDSENAVRQ